MPPVGLTDESLMHRVARGDQLSLEPLVRRYANPLLTFIRRMVGDAQQSEDLFQEVFLAIWVKRSQYRQGWPFRPWLYRIAVNACRAKARSGRLGSIAGANATLDHQPHNDGSPFDALVADESAARVEAAVGRLPDMQRAVVVLRIWNDLSYAQIADVLEVRAGTARSYMHQALKSLRHLLEDATEPVRRAGEER